MFRAVGAFRKVNHEINSQLLSVFLIDVKVVDVVIF